MNILQHFHPTRLHMSIASFDRARRLLARYLGSVSLSTHHPPFEQVVPDLSDVGEHSAAALAQLPR